MYAWRLVLVVAAMVVAAPLAAQQAPPAMNLKHGHGNFKEDNRLANVLGRSLLNLSLNGEVAGVANVL